MLEKLKAANIQRQREWDSDKQLSLLFYGVALAGEVGEACNIIKKFERIRLGLKGGSATVDQLAVELADIVIYADLIATRAGIDLPKVVRETFNAKSEELDFKTRIE